MTSPRELIQRVDAALILADESRPEELRQLAESVAGATARLAERVGACDALWRQGRFDEARQAARRGEDLREAAALVTASAVTAWSGWCRRLGAPLPVPVDEARLRYVLERLDAGPGKLEQLLREYRRMTLGRAPLIDRLRVLRVIAKADPEQPAWLDDVRAFEQARHDELSRSLRDAEKRADAAQLRALKEELSSDPWLVPPPPRLLPAVEVALAPLVTRAAEQRYEALAEALRAAHGALDEARCHAAVEEWEALQATTRVAPPTASAGEIAPVRAWLKDKAEQRAADDAFANACAALEAGLDAGAPLAEIERLASAALRHERGLPQVLGARAASRVEALSSGQRARNALQLALVLAGAVVVGGLVTASWQHRSRAANVQRWTGQLGAALASDDLAATRALLGELARSDAEAYQAPEVRDLEAKLVVREQAEAERAAGFAAAASTVEGAGVGHVDFDALLRRAEALARTTTERALVEEWRHRRVVHQDEQQRYRDQALGPELEALTRDYEALREAVARDGADVQERVAACLAVARRLAAAGDASPRLRERAAAIVSGAEALAERALAQGERQQQIAQALERLRGTITADELAAGLMAFSNSFPDHPRATEFVKAASARDAWRAVDAWRALVVGLGPVRVQSRAAASDRRRAIEAYRTAHPLAPVAADVERLRAYYACAEETLEGDDVAGLKDVRALLDNRLLKDSFTVTDREGRRYYLLDGALPEPRGPDASAVYSFDYVVNARLVTRRKVWRTQEEGFDAVAQPSPQRRFSEAGWRLLEAPGRAWETLYLELLAAVLAEQDMDPILVASLARTLAELGRSVVPFGAEDLTAYERELKLVRDDVAWMDPDEREAESIRKRAQAALKRLPAVRPLVARVEAALRRPQVLWPAGVLLRDVRPVQGGAARGELYVVVAGTPMSLRRVGRFVDGAAQLDAAALSDVPQGTLVFATNEAEDQQ